MEEPDFSGVDPARVPEARRRIAAIRSYLALPKPTTADANRISKSVGLSRWTFVRLVRAWTEYRDARRLVVDRSGSSGRETIIDPAAVEIIDEAIRDFGTDAKLASIAGWIEAHCLEKGIVPPARSTIWKHIRKVQAAASTPVSGPPRIVIGRMWFQLPVEGLPAEAMPMALVAVLLPERIIVAHRVSADTEGQPSVTDLIGDLADRQTDDGETRPLLISAEDRHAAAAQLDLIGLGNIRSPRRSLQIEISKAFGGRLGQLKVTYRPSRAGTAQKRKVRQVQPLTKAEATDAIETAIDAHNAATLTAAPPFTFTPSRASEPRA